MLYYLQEWRDWFSPLRIFQYITFRAFLASGTAFLISLVFGPWLIQRLRAFKAEQVVRGADVSATLHSLHGGKAGTPTMGGLLIVFSVLSATVVWAEPGNLYVTLALLTMLVMGGIGFADDYLKITRQGPGGLSGRTKLALQTAWVIVLLAILWTNPQTRQTTAQLMVPFFKDPVIEAMPLLLAAPFLWLVMVGASNAVNLTDGLDGLAIGCTNSVALSYLIMAYVAGHAVFADYLQVPFLLGTGELAVFCGALLGGGLGFLWFNCHPAKVFMGDTGSLALGGSIAAVAILIKQELVLILVGAVFVVEALSVVLQVGWFRFSGGKRIFRCAPLHHHFEFLEKERAEREGRDLEVVETMITIRFWIVSIICALVGVASLKIR